MKFKILVVLTAAAMFLSAAGNNNEGNNDARSNPRLLNYQGYLTDTLSNPITNPSVSMTFAIYDAVSSGNLKWTEIQGSVGVDKGIFHILLGGVNPIPDSVFKTGADRWLELTIGGQALSPRTRIVSVPYAYSATFSDTALYAANSAPDYDWSYRVTDGADTTLQMGGRWGIARFGNTMYGNADSTHVNFGVGSTTGANGQNYKYITVGGGWTNSARNLGSTVGGGVGNIASNICATVGGGSSNEASGTYAAVTGGRYNKARGQYSVVNGGGAPNESDSSSAIGDYSVIGGGLRNRINGAYATIGGGFNNVANGYVGTVAGGSTNAASGYIATVGGGSENIASSFLATVGGGWSNTASDTNAIVSGGYYNYAGGKYSAILGGYADTITATGDYSYLFGINSNLTQDSTFMVDMPHVWFGTEANGYEFPYGRGTDGQVMKTNGSGLLSWGSIAYVDSARVAANAHKLQGKDTVDFNVDYVNEGQVNSIANAMIQDGAVTTTKIVDTAVTMPKIAPAGAVAGQVIKWNGTAWQPSADSSMDSDWSYRITDGADTTLQTGGRWGIARFGNTMYGNADSTHVNLGIGSTTGTNGQNYKYITVGGGYGNTAIYNWTTIGGGDRNSAGLSYATVSGGVQNNAGGQCATVSGGSTNIATSECATVAGGNVNTASNYNATVSGGQGNIASGYIATVGGGKVNRARGAYAVVSGGGGGDYADSNSAIGNYSAIGGGYGNIARGNSAVIGGGRQNIASSWYSIVGGGQNNTASNQYSTVGGGEANVASGMRATVVGGSVNQAAGPYSSILGGFADTITATGDYSYLFGINSNLTQDSTFMVDMPHVWFGTEANGYEFPYGRGTDGQIMKTNGSGLLSWGSIAYVDSARIAANAHKLQGKDTTDLNNSYVNEGQVNSIDSLMLKNNAVTMPKISQAGATAGQVIKWNGTAWLPSADSSMDSDWSYRVTDGADTTLQMGGRWGLARAGNTLYGNADSTHVNLGVGSTTGTNGYNYKYCTVSGGKSNTASNDFATVSGGENNSASAYASVGGGLNNTASLQLATVGGGELNTASAYATVSGGLNNNAGSYYATVGGGRDNTANGDQATVGGGIGNHAIVYATVGGGYYNNANGYAATIGGGQNNEATPYGSVTGGRNNSAYTYAIVGGGFQNNAHQTFATVGGGQYNTAIGNSSFIGGGEWNYTSGTYATIAGGQNDTASGYASTVGGGVNNVASGNYGIVTGGAWNRAAGSYTTVGAGIYNTASGHLSTIAGGQNNTTADSFNFIGGGYLNRTSGKYSAILGGYADTIFATGNYSYLFGINSNLTQDSTFMVDMPHVWFGTEAGGYEFPYGRGTDGQVMKTNGSGILSWGSIAYVDSARVAANAHKLQGKDTVDFNVDYVNEGQVNSIANAMIQDGAVTTPKIADTAVTMPKIAPAGAVAGQVIKWNGTAWQPSADSSMDNDWTISGSNMYSAVSGNVGIGTTNPLNKLHVQNGNVVIDRPLATSILSLGTVAGVTGRIFAGDAGGGNLNTNYNQVKMTANPANTEELLRLHTGADAMSNTGTAALYFGQFNLADMAAIKAVNEGGQPLNRTAGLSFWTEPAGTGVPLQERMRIAGNGNIGIGTTTPSQKLDVSGTAKVTGFEMPTGATNGYILTSNASGVGTWQALPVAPVTSVFGRTGAVVAASGDYTTTLVTEGTNLYFTDARAQAAITGGASTITTSNLTANRALLSDGSGKVAVSATTNTELGYLSGVTSAIQTQLSGKAPLLSPTFTGNVTMPGTGIWNSSGNVGIGLTSPSAKLDVVGTVKIADGTQALGRVFTSDANGLGSWQAIPNDNDWTFRVTDGADTTLQMGGRWGITRFGNTLLGNADSTHVNLGNYSETGSPVSNTHYCTIGGGYNNSARDEATTVAGGYANHAYNNYTTITGGFGNIAYGSSATISGGYGNATSGNAATVGGGAYNKARGLYSVVSGGGSTTEADSNSAIGDNSAIGGGYHNTALGNTAVICGGYSNTASNIYTTVGGGYLNTAGNDRATVNGGTNNTASGMRSTIGGGWYNTASNFEATVAGGTNNNASGNQSTIAGGGYNVSIGTCCAIGGGYGNSSDGNGSVIAGGESNSEVASFAAIGGGKYNNVNGDYSHIGGGENNQVLGYHSAILGGYADTIFATGHYSYLFGINSNLTQDSTFMVDLPHIRFGKESGGYEFPTTDGTNGQALVTNGSGQVSWGSPVDADWTISGNNMYSAVSGNVGIGASSPLVRLEVRASGTCDTAAIFRGNLVIQSKATGSAVLELGEGLDYAEGFDVTQPDKIKPGTVLVIDPKSPGKLAVSCRAYDTKVAGIVAGGKGLGSGVRLGTGDFDHNVALAGRVYCNVDASTSAVEPGDLLTTANTPGYAMKAQNYDRAKGAVLGKAMERLEKGQKGQILVLVSLQ